MTTIHTILHPTDFSEYSETAIRLARALARDYHARLVVLHAYQVPVTPPEMASGLPPVEGDLKEQLLTRMRALRLDDATESVSYRVVEGYPVDVILDAAREEGADLIVMGTHGRTGLRRLMMGSVAEAVNRKAACPVVTVRSGQVPPPEPALASAPAEAGSVENAEAGPEDWRDAPGPDDPSREVAIPVGRVTLPGTLQWAGKPHGVVVFAHGSGSSRHSPRNRAVATALVSAGFATLLLDLLTAEEGEDREKVFDVELLADRLAAAAEWVVHEPEVARLPIGYFGASTGSAAALMAAASHPDRVVAVVSRGGRPDLAWDDLPAVQAPTLLIVGGDDEPVLSWNRDALERLRCPKELAVVPGATHLFEEPGALEEVARLAVEWFTHHVHAGALAAGR